MSAIEVDRLSHVYSGAEGGVGTSSGATVVSGFVRDGSMTFMLSVSMGLGGAGVHRI